MTLQFPPNWRQLKFPDKRAELIEYLKEIESTEIGSDPHYDEFDIDQIVHFFFDDTNLGDQGESAVGEILFDDVEELTIRQLTTTLGDVLGELGNVKSRSFLSHRRWPDIRRHASTALAKLQEGGLPRIER